MSALDEARRRANAMLATTHLFDALGITDLGADSRALARLTLELADELEAERSARVALQEARDRCLEIIAKAACDEFRGAA